MRETAADLVRLPPPPVLAGVVHSISAYRENGMPSVQREAGSLVFPLIVSFGTPFQIGLDRAPGAGDAQPSFAAGLHPGPVHIRSDGAAACLEADLDPIGAFRLFGGAVADLASAMIPTDALFGRDGAALVERIGNAAADARPALLAAFVAERLGPPPSAVTQSAFAALSASRGTARIGAIATALGVSRKHLSARFAAETGLAPKTVARLLRFANARRLARTAAAGGWAGVAAGAGYADQAHLAREFAALAGESPTAWAARISVTDPRLVRDEPW